MIHPRIVSARAVLTTRFLRYGLQRASAIIISYTKRERGMAENLFLKIIEREIPADIVYETEDVLAFRDINPQAPVHILIIPKIHIRTVNDIMTDQAELIGKLYLAAKDIAQEEGLSEEGYRLVMNCNKAAGQVVFHIHLHLLGGRMFAWPPG